MSGYQHIRELLNPRTRGDSSSSLCSMVITLGLRRSILGRLLVVTAIAVVIFSTAVLSRALAQSANATWETVAGGKMKFDVVSVKRNISNELPHSNVPLGPGETYSPNGGLFSASHQNLLTYIMFAYKISSLNDLEGVPDWVGVQHFDIQARSTRNATKDQIRLMLQSVLADRFKLDMQIETKTEPIFLLVLSKPGKLGPGLQRSRANSCSWVSEDRGAATATGFKSGNGLNCGDFTVVPPSAPGRFRLIGRNVSIELIARQLPSGALAAVARPVFDATGLQGNFDFNIEWTPRLPIQPPEFVTDNPGPTFVQALNDQLGLKLVARTGPVDVFVIRHIEEPTPN